MISVAAFHRARPGSICLLALALALCGCGFFPLRVEICGPASVNRKLPLTFVARAVERGEYQEETYAAATQRAGRPDPARLWAGVLNSTQTKGIRQRFSIKLPDKKALGLYFLFAQPYGSWKVFFEPPLSGTLRVELEASGVKRAAR